MGSSPRTTLGAWLLCGAIFLLGLLALSADVFARRHGTTPESELTVVRGIATNADISRVQGTEYARFTIEGQTVDYSSDLRGYPQVIDAIRHGEPMTIGVSQKRETLLPRNGWVPLYTLSIGGEQLRSYQETINTGYRASHALSIVAAVLLALGGWGLFSCYRNRHRSIVPLSSQQRAAAWNDPKRIRNAAILFSLAMYGATLAAVLQPDSLPTFRAVFGESPLGMPLRLFAGLYFTVLFLPLPFAAWHGFKILFRGALPGAVPLPVEKRAAAQGKSYAACGRGASPIC